MGSGDGHNHDVPEQAPVDPYDHEHDMEECMEFSGRHQQFIKDNINEIKKQCKEFKVCLNELYSKENIHLILQGGDIDLKLICGFLYPEASNGTTPQTDCGAGERDAIREDVEEKLEASINLKTETEIKEWEDVEECLHNHNDTESPDSSHKHLHHKHLQQVCRIAKQEPDVCNTRVHHHLQSFLNHQLEHIQCTCNSLKNISPRFRMRYRIAVGGGALVFLILLALFIFCMCRRRKRTKKRKQLARESLQRVDYHLSRNNSQVAIEDPYSVCHDPSNTRSKGTVAVKPPELPPRYTKYPEEKRDPTLDYLLPADLPSNSPVPDRSLLSSARRGADGASIEDISGKPEVRKPGYDQLGPRYEDLGYSMAINPPEQKNTYFVLEEENKNGITPTS